jgi:peptidylprolyl isomerase
MKLTSALLLLAASATVPLAAQTTTPKPATTTAAKPVARPAVSACVKLPELSPKIPAIAAGTPCAKHLYTITTVPAVKLENVSPLEGANLKADLGIEPSSFSLDYIDTKIGTGAVAGAHNFYSIHYTGYLLDGTKFDSSLDRGEPLSVAYGQHQVIPGWDTGFAGMRVGGKRRLIIPFQLAYGATAHGPIPAKSTLVFDVELLGISETPPPAKPATPSPLPKPATPPAAAAPSVPPTSTPAATPAPAAVPAATPPPTSPKP